MPGLRWAVALKSLADEDEMLAVGREAGDNVGLEDLGGLLDDDHPRLEPPQEVLVAGSA